MKTNNTLRAPLITSSSQTSPLGKPTSKVHPSSRPSARTPFSAVAPPQYIQVGRLQLRLTLDTIMEETMSDDYSCMESCNVVISEDKEASESVFSSKSFYKTCFWEVQDRNVPSFSYNFRCV
ncbi:hypothetical protein CDL12_04841 [Handroanthus impetiginosus]|uniref:Uncharacterized protein n=1 Tax=Handroanthus impetiginosus TaxID=429701 RepID=A0A2G9HY39_9LAMI|nr:hypothetical protein CDL12_04841 [Handroanthus impetiginosus]